MKASKLLEGAKSRGDKVANKAKAFSEEHKLKEKASAALGKAKARFSPSVSPDVAEASMQVDVE